MKVGETLFFAKGKVNKLFVSQKEERVEVYFAKLPLPSNKAKFLLGYYEGLKEKGHLHKRIMGDMQKEFCICRSTIYKYLKIAKMDEKSLDYLDRGKLTHKACYKFAALTISERETIYKLLDGCPGSKITDAKANAIRKKIKNYKSGETDIKKILSL